MTQFLIIFRVVDRIDKGQKFCLTAAMVPYSPEWRLRACSLCIISWVSLWLFGSKIWYRALYGNREFFNLLPTRIKSTNGDRELIELDELNVFLFFNNSDFFKKKPLSIRVDMKCSMHSWPPHVRKMFDLFIVCSCHLRNLRQYATTRSNPADLCF